MSVGVLKGSCHLSDPELASQGRQPRDRAVAGGPSGGTYKYSLVRVGA